MFASNLIRGMQKPNSIFRRRGMALADYFYQKPVTETERLRIRPMSAADVPALTEWMPDPLIYTYWGKGPSKGEKNPQLLFEKEEKPTKSLHLGIALKDADQVIGDIWVYLIENDRIRRGPSLLPSVRKRRRTVPKFRALRPAPPPWRCSRRSRSCRGIRRSSRKYP